MDHFEKHGNLNDAQHGFRKRRSTETQLIVTIHDLAKGLDEKAQIDAVLLDFAKAFDKVPHKRLLCKLSHYGIRGHILKWISTFLENRTQRVICDGKESGESNVTSGVPQGTVLGPLLFLAYINDLPECVTSTARLYADDSLIYRVIANTQDAGALQEDLDKLQAWEGKWLMHFNPDKCEVLRVTQKRKPISAEYFLHGKCLKIVNSAKYLGLTIDSKLTFNKHVDNTVKAANNVRALLQRNIQFCPRNTKAYAYQTLVRPIVEYASTVWAPHTEKNISKVENAQRRAARFVMSNWERTASVTEMLKMLDWQSLEERRSRARLLMLHKIVNNTVDITPSLYLRPATIRGGEEAVRFTIPSSRVSAFQHSFFPNATKLWFNLPRDFTLLPLNDFQRRISCWVSK